MENNYTNLRVDLKNDKAEFACKVCLLKYKTEKQIEFCGCPWRDFDGEYCDEMTALLKL